MFYESNFIEEVEIEITIPLTVSVDAKEDALRYAANYLAGQTWLDIGIYQQNGAQLTPSWTTFSDSWECSIGVTGLSSTTGTLTWQNY